RSLPGGLLPKIFYGKRGTPRAVAHWSWRNELYDPLSSFVPELIPKLADPDSSCVNSSGTSIAKKYSGPMRYGPSAQAPTLAKMSQALRSLVLEPRHRRGFSFGSGPDRRKPQPLSRHRPERDTAADDAGLGRDQAVWPGSR